MWLFITIISVTLGALVGVVFVWVWSLFRIFFLNYGDSGPSWVNLVNNIVFIVGLVLCLVGGQWVYFRKVRQ